ncbi:hypothetical protein LCGC14_2374590 [marine sediment metagenome]|uniref:Uncharacterized protein n=1 Tax=marine sediment metagenome TaxID=412755 RepID=A0A0F9C2T9_9ZZZZ
MATGRRVTTAPGTRRIGQVGGVGVPVGVLPFPTEPFGPEGFDQRPATERIIAEPESFESQIIAAANLGIGGSIELQFKVPFERLRIVQRTALVTLALGFGRTPSAADFDDLVAGAIYYDFQTPTTRDLGVLNMGGVALTDDLLVIAMAGRRYETV